jgi:hypothetical protein
MLSILTILAGATTLAPLPIYSSGDQMVDARLATLGRLTEGDATALLRQKPGIQNLRAPTDAKGYISCPTISGSYSYSSRGSNRVSGRYRVSTSCHRRP